MGGLQYVHQQYYPYPGSAALSSMKIVQAPWKVSVGKSYRLSRPCFARFHGGIVCPQTVPPQTQNHAVDGHV